MKKKNKDKIEEEEEEDKRNVKRGVCEETE